MLMWNINKTVNRDKISKVKKVSKNVNRTRLLHLKLIRYYIV